MALFLCAEWMCSPQSYARVRETLRDGDVLLCRRPHSLIALMGRGEWSHAGMVSTSRGRRVCMEMREWRGRDQRSISTLLADYPAGIDVFRLDERVGDPLPNAMVIARAADAMYGLVTENTAYGYRHVARSFLSRVPWLRHALVSAVAGQAHCSEAIALAFDAAGVRLVPRLPSHFTEPSDLARSALLWHVMRIVA